MSPDLPGWHLVWEAAADDGLTDATADYFLVGRAYRVTNAERIVMAMLADDPIGNGRHLSEGTYQLTVSPLRISYEIDDEARTVTVAAVRYFPV